jgi:hypothetical protein
MKHLTLQFEISLLNRKLLSKTPTKVFLMIFFIIAITFTPTAVINNASFTTHGEILLVYNN